MTFRFNGTCNVTRDKVRSLCGKAFGLVDMLIERKTFA